MKKRNIARMVWISAIFLELIVILIMVMDYKIHYQYLTQNKLYFYDCSGTLCVTEVKDSDHLLYSYYDCGYEECPIYKKELGDSYVLLEDDSLNFLFDYRTGKMISQGYDDYQFINQDYIIVTKDNLQGIITLDNQIIVAPSYDQIGYVQGDYLAGYNFQSILAKKGEQYGIISFKSGKIIEPFQYEEEQMDELLAILKNES